MMTQPRPRLSICIPTYNRAGLLEYCLENLRALDAHGLDYEVVVLNHASTDNTAELLTKLQAGWPNLRVYHQTKQVTLAGQCVAALRLARGELAFLMADDDKLIIETFVASVRRMLEQSKVVATYAPWHAYDDAEEKVLHGYFEVKQPVEFSAGQGFDLFKYMAERVMYPEIVIFRREALEQVMFTHDGGASHNGLWMLELLKLGTVRFQTEVYYLEVAVVKKHLTRPSRMNLDFTLNYLDNCRATLEMMAMRIIQASGGDMVSNDVRLGVHEILLSYLVPRLEVAFNRAMAMGDYLPASELAQRIMLWRGPFRQDLQQLAQQALFGAGLQQVAWLLESMSWKEELVIYDFADIAPLEKMIRQRFPNIRMRIADEATIRTLDADKTLLMVRYTKQKALFAEQFLPGHVVSLEEAIEYRKIYPMQYSLAVA
jgi:hypothetical protein